MPEPDLDALRAALAVLLAEDSWTRRDIDREGTCDDCGETRFLVAAYDDPTGESEPWLCLECSRFPDALLTLTTHLPALLAQSPEHAQQIQDALAEEMRLTRRLAGELAQIKGSLRQVVTLDGLVDISPTVLLVSELVRDHGELESRIEAALLVNTDPEVDRLLRGGGRVPDDLSGLDES